MPETVKVPSRREIVVKRKVKEVGFLANEEYPVYKNSLKRSAGILACSAIRILRKLLT